MERHSVDAIVNALNGASVRYLIAGGLAVVAHGYLRFTADIDLIIDLEQANVRRAVAALESLGYRPRAPVAFEDLADPRLRAEWVREKNLTVFSAYSPQHPMTEIDLFAEAPLDFDGAYRRAVRKEVAPGVAATFIGLRDLRRLKERGFDPLPTYHPPRESDVPQEQRSAHEEGEECVALPEAAVLEHFPHRRIGDGGCERAHSR